MNTFKEKSSAWVNHAFNIKAPKMYNKIIMYNIIQSSINTKALIISVGAPFKFKHQCIRKRIIAGWRSANQLIERQQKSNQMMTKRDTSSIQSGVKLIWHHHHVKYIVIWFIQIK